MDDALTAHGAATIGAVGAVLLLTGRTRLQLLAGFMAVGVAQAGLAYALSGDVNLGRGLGAATIVVALAGLMALAALTALLVRRPVLVLPLLLVAAPFRLPLDIDSRHRFLVAVAESGELGRLLPLYVVLTASVLASVVGLLRGAEPRSLPNRLAWPTAALLVLASLSLLWTQELTAGTNVLFYFLNPFAAMLVVAARAPFPNWMPRALAAIGVALGCVFAAFGLWQVATERLLFFAPKLEVANTYGSIFRVTSLFRDPSLYGRHLVAAIAVLLVALWLRKVQFVVAGALIAFIWAGLYFSYSQSSMVALFTVVLAITAVAGDRPAKLAVATIGIVLAAGTVAFLAAELRDESARRVTSDRSRRVEVTLDVVRDHPIAGVGIGSQPAASRERSERPGREENFVSHTTPLTVAAELGIVGLALYLALLVGAVDVLRKLWRHRTALALALAGVLLALTMHSLFYSGFFEDPITWLVLGVAAAALSAGPREPELAASR